MARGSDKLVAIIGFGTAGVNALIGLRTSGYEGRVVVFTEGGARPYSPILTSYYAAGDKQRAECFPWSEALIDSLGAEIHAACPVASIDPEAHEIVYPGGSLVYDKCVIATGSQPMTWGFPEVEGYEPLVLRSMEDAERLKAALLADSCRRVLVSGASMVALKTLEAALKRGKRSTLVGMNPHVLDFNALPEAASRFERGLRDKGVELRLGQTIAGVELLADQPSGRLRVTFSNGEVDDFDEIAVAHGMRSNLDFIGEGALEIDRALVVDDFMRTSDPDVYAAGDVAQATELISGEKRVVGIWKNAVLQGQCAGRAIAAELAGAKPSPECAFAGSISTNTIAVDGTLFISAGTVELSAQRRTEVRELQDTTVVYVFEDGPAGPLLVGFNLVCDQDVEGSSAYDTAAMLTMRIERDAAGRIG